MSSLARFVARILSRLQSPAILHRTRTILGGRLVRPLADLVLEDLIPDLEPHPALPRPPTEPPRAPAVRPAGSTPIATAPPVQARFKTSPPMAAGPPRPSEATFLASLLSAARRQYEPGPSSPSGPAPDATSSPGPIAFGLAPGSVVGSVPHRERSAFQATGDESPAPSTPSAIERLNQSLLQASRPDSDERPTFPVLHELAAPVPVGRRLPTDRSDAGGSGPQAERPSIAAGPETRSAVPSLEARLLDRAAQSSPRILSESARSALAGFLGLDVGQTRFYDNAAADELNRRLGSDALSMGRQVFFRQGRFEPGDPHGLALIGHELTHVHAGLTGFPRQPAPGPASQAEERAAVANELRVLRELGVSARPAARGEAAPPAPAAANPTSAPAAGVKMAATGRLEDVQPEEDTGGGLSEQQLAALRELLYRDLMERIRIDQERGA